ncbi:MAG: hypothetical protein ABI760_02640 [Ferruginibacter sp.]
MKRHWVGGIFQIYTVKGGFKGLPTPAGTHQSNEACLNVANPRDKQECTQDKR